MTQAYFCFVLWSFCCCCCLFAVRQSFALLLHFGLRARHGNHFWGLFAGNICWDILIGFSCLGDWQPRTLLTELSLICQPDIWEHEAPHLYLIWQFVSWLSCWPLIRPNNMTVVMISQIRYFSSVQIAVLKKLLQAASWLSRTPPSATLCIINALVITYSSVFNNAVVCWIPAPHLYSPCHVHVYQFCFQR